METLEEVNRVGWQRLYPSITNSSWLVLRERRRLFERWLASLGSEKLTVLDVGGRIQPYRRLLSGREKKYVAVDMRRSPLVDVLGRAEQLPFASEQFDLVLCTQMLQYVRDPAQAVAEMFRLLRPGGHLLLSVPAVYPSDSEWDSWRFLRPGLRHLLRPFRRIEIAREGGTISGLFRTVCVWLTLFARPAFVRSLLRYSLVPIFNLSAVVLESAFGKSNQQFTPNYSVFAHKE